MTNGSDAIVEIAGLSIATLGGKRVIDDLSIEILAGENRALVGESGSGKTTLALALMGRIRSGLVHEAGTIFVDGANVLSLKGSSLRRYRAETVSWLSQDPALSLTPHMTVRALLSESVPMDDEDALGLLGRVGLSGVKGLLDRRPRSLSGGQRRRVAIAKAIASKPRVLILDEPTAGLDGATADEVVATIKGICAESGMSVVAITHDLDVAGKFAESVTVLKEGCVLETVSHSELMNNPGTDYARKLVDAQRLERRPGDEMDSSAGAPVFSASSFDVVTPDGKVATRNAAFSINHGRGLSLFGPSGSGKSTIVRAITGERPAERGSVALDLGDGDMHVLARSFKDRSQTELAAVQMVPQDPATSLNPALCVDTQLSRAVRRVHPRWSRKEVRERVSELLALVRLPDEIKRQHPRSLSGGQAQRVAIARALAHEPKVLVCDESTSALDPTTQKDILDTLDQLKRDEGLALVVVTHAERVARYTCEEEIAVPFEG